VFFLKGEITHPKNVAVPLKQSCSTTSGAFLFS
jgi:hypothetical protein